MKCFTISLADTRFEEIVTNHFESDYGRHFAYISGRVPLASGLLTAYQAPHFICLLHFPSGLPLSGKAVHMERPAWKAIASRLLTEHISGLCSIYQWAWYRLPSRPFLINCIVGALAWLLKSLGEHFTSHLLREHTLVVTHSPLCHFTWVRRWRTSMDYEDPKWQTSEMTRRHRTVSECPPFVWGFKIDHPVCIELKNLMGTLTNILSFGVDLWV